MTDAYFLRKIRRRVLAVHSIGDEALKLERGMTQQIEELIQGPSASVAARRSQ